MSKKSQFPQDKKVFILNYMRMHNFVLWGVKKNGHDFKKSKTKWEELYAYCQSIDAPYVQCVQEVRNLFDGWKHTFAQKVKRKSKSGAGPGREFTEADKILYHLLRENPYHNKDKVGTVLYL